MQMEHISFCLLYIQLLILTSFPQIQSLKNKDKPCSQFSTCKCIFPTGSGFNLNYVSQNLSAKISNDSEIFLHMCADVIFDNNVTKNMCNQNISICYVNKNKNESISLGKANDMKFISESQYNPVSLQFNNTNGTTNIKLKCDESASTPTLKLESIEGSVYNLELQSKHACVRSLTAAEGPPGGLSTGSLLVIMLLITILLYFGGGMLCLKLLRGAEGREMIPNVDFWMDLPYLVRDGVLFALNGFRPATSYDRI